MSDTELRLEMLEDAQLKTSLEVGKVIKHMQSEFGYAIIRDAGLMLLLLILWSRCT